MAKELYIIKTKAKDGTTKEISHGFDRKIMTNRLEFLNKVVQVRNYLRKYYD